MKDEGSSRRLRCLMFMGEKYTTIETGSDQKEDAPSGCGSPPRCTLMVSLSLKPITRLQLAPIHRRLLRFPVGSGGAGGPAEIKIRPQRKHHRSAIHFGENADSLFGSRQSKVQRLPELD